MKNIILSLVAVVFLVGGTSFAAEGKKSYKKMNYGMAGCGLGAMFIDRNAILPQIGAWFVNSISASQTFGITTGTSNCKEGHRDSAKMEQEVFVRVNLAKLNREAAEGGGENLAAFAEVLGCEEQAFARMSQEKYDALFQSGEASDVLGSYVREIQSTPDLAESCSRIIG